MCVWWDSYAPGVGRVNIEGLFAQEDDILEFLVTHDGLKTLMNCSEGESQ